MNLEILENLGLDQREIHTYLALLKLGSASIRDIAVDLYTDRDLLESTRGNHLRNP